MPLSCYCGDPGDWDFWYDTDNTYSTLQTSRRKRCCSCDKLIDLGAACLRHYRWRGPKTDIEERIYDEEVPMASHYHCEECADLFFSLDELGFCISPGENMHELLADYYQMVEDENEIRRDQDQA